MLYCLMVCSTNTLTYIGKTMTAHISDFTKEPLAIVVDLINHDNPLASLTSEMITLGLPTTTASSEAEERNTEVTVTGVQERGVVGSVTTYYSRLNLAAFITEPGFHVPLEAMVNIADLVEQLNIELGINITAADFIDEPLPTFAGTPGETIAVTIKFNADSLVWVGNAEVLVRGDDVNINTLITNVRLSGLNAPL